MGLHWWNRNYVGTHFGGSLYSMIDPFLMLTFTVAITDSKGQLLAEAEKVLSVKKKAVA